MYSDLSGLERLIPVVILVKVESEAPLKHLVVETVECEEDIVHLFNIWLIGWTTSNRVYVLNPLYVSLQLIVYRKSEQSFTGG